MNNYKILVVDDDIDFIEQVKLFLQSEGYLVITSESQKEAEEVIVKENFDLAIVDLMMENHDSGVILAHRIKRKNDNIPVIMATAVTAETGLEIDADTEGEKEWFKVDLVMDKGIRKDQLIREVKKLLEK